MLQNIQSLLVTDSVVSVWCCVQEKRRTERAEQQRVRADKEKERQARLAVSDTPLSQLEAAVYLHEAKC